MRPGLSHRKSWILSALLGVVGWLAIVPGVASAAGYAQGPNYYYTKIFPYYMFNAITTTTGFPASAWTGVVKNESGTVPGGYIGAMAIMFKTRGSTPPAVCHQSAEHLNGSPTHTFYVKITPGCGSGPIYFSYGYSYAYNGNGYTTYGGYRSPSETS
jgi:hypothetical protein